MKSSARIASKGYDRIIMDLIMCISILFLVSVPCRGGEVPDLTELSLEELMDVDITSVSKKAQKLSDAAAAVFVITQEDIRRSGATSIPEVLRMVPGLQVARVDANKWAISSRGFNGRFSNKLLVLMDGRNVFTPKFSGVYWHMQDALLEDIDRIEVIRGPGATLWGANAVNGVVNIITKRAKDTQGAFMTTGAGAEEKGFGSVRYGGAFDENTTYRTYAQYFKRDDSVLLGGDDANDAWDTLQTGFCMDRQLTGKDTLTLQGDVYTGNADEQIELVVDGYNQVLKDKNDSNGANLIGRWVKAFENESNMALQLYYDHFHYSSILVDELRDTFDLDLQHRFLWNPQHETIWGIGYRHTRDKLDEPFMTYVPEERQDDLWSLFVQDESRFLDKRLSLTVGSKFEYNDYTGFEIQPNIRLLWAISPRQSAWASISRAVRTPSRVEHGLINSVLVPGSTGNLTMYGTDRFKSETVLAYELGYRVRPLSNLSLDIAGFYNNYDKLRTNELKGASPNYWIEFDNKMKGTTYGVELTADWAVRNEWRLSGGYTFLKMQLNPDGDSTDSLAKVPEGENPRHQFTIRSSMDLPKGFELDVWARYVDNLPAQNVPCYVTIDFRIGWNLSRNLSFSVCGQNLLDNRHPEFGSDLNISLPITEVERSAYGKITWRF